MAHLNLMAIPVLLVTATSILCFEDHKYEAHSIMKRMAREKLDFEGHDFARVHLVEGQGRVKRRLYRRDIGDLSNADGGSADVKTIQLELSEGGSVDLAVRQSSIVGPDTVVSVLTAKGRIVKKRGVDDCYFHGTAGDSSGEGTAAISHCDGLFGFASSPDYEYFFHPVGSQISKRNASEDYDAHVMWRRSASQSTKNSTVSDPDYGSDYVVGEEEKKVDIVERNIGDEDSIVIEMAIFSDQRYWNRLLKLYPGREDDFLLTKLAGTQALFSDPEEVGFDLNIKLKLLEHWDEDPEEYKFTEDFGNNMRSGCKYTTSQFNFDIHAINSGITAWNDGQIGLAYLGGVCKSTRCMVVNGIDLNTFVGFAHELGHTLGLPHQSKQKCPEDLLIDGGFMGGAGRRAQFYFSPCMKHMLQTFLNGNDGKNGKCLFVENMPTLSGAKSKFNELPKLFPGQVRTADELCEILAGLGFRFGPNERPDGSGICKWFICQNEDESSPKFGKVQVLKAPIGFPCGPSSFCEKDRSCQEWSTTKVSEEVRLIQVFSPNPKWSEWSSEVTPCSRSCGTGVRMRRRKCLHLGFITKPMCPGLPMYPELCNTNPCPGESEEQVRQLRGNEVCQRFLDYDVKLDLKGAEGFFPQAQKVTARDAGPNWEAVRSKSCMLKCRRDPSTKKGAVDAVMPDGTPCSDSEKSNYDLQRFEIDTRCVRGLCLEFSDCPGGATEVKDNCGVCGGDGSRCVEKVFDELGGVPKYQRVELLVIPEGATDIDVRTDRRRNLGTTLELWTQDGHNVIGVGGEYTRKGNHDGVVAAGAEWSYYYQVAYLRTRGPLKEPVVIKALTLSRPIYKISVKYTERVD